MLKYKGLLLGVVLILCATFISKVFFTSTSPADESPQKFKATIEQIHQEQLAVQSILEKDSLKNQSIHTTQPFFIFEEDSITYWSDHYIKFTLDDFDQTKTEQLVLLRNGYYYVKITPFRKYKLVSILPLWVQFDVKNEFLPDQINEAVFGRVADFNLSVKEKLAYAYHDLQGNLLFYTSIKIQHPNVWSDIVYLSAVLIGLFFIGVHSIKVLKEHYQSVQLHLFILVLIIGLRFLVLYLSHSHLFATWLFDPKEFASSMVSPSYADLLLNSVFVLTILLLLLKLMPGWNIDRIRSKKTSLKYALGTLFLVANLAGVIYFLNTIKGFYQNSQWNYDVTQRFVFNEYEWVYLLLLFIVGINYFFIHRVSLQLYRRTLSSSFIKNVFTSGTILTVITVICLFMGVIWWWLIAVQGSLIFVVLQFKLYQQSVGFNQKTFLHLVLVVMFISLSCGYLNFENHQLRLMDKVERFGQQLLTDGDLQSEFYLFEAAKKIENDSYIQDKILDDYFRKEKISKKIKRKYLNKYLDRYDKKIYIYDNRGDLMYSEGEVHKYSWMLREYHKKKYSTDYPGLYYVNDYSNSSANKLVNFVRIKKQDKVTSYIILELSLKKVIPHSVFPRLLSDDRAEMQKEKRSYAIYLNGDLQYSSGQFNYTKLDRTVPIQQETFKAQGHIHHVIKGNSNQVVVVSVPDTKWNSILTNFSFVFMVLIFILLGLLSTNAIWMRISGIKLNFSARIQLYLSIAYLFPLFVVSIATISIINSNYKADLEKSFLQKSELISERISDLISQSSQLNEADKIEEVLQNLVFYTEHDIYVYDQTGQLMFSSQPIIFSKGLLSNRINPEAYQHIIDDNNRLLQANESIGQLFFNTVYRTLYSSQNKGAAGVIALPYYNSEIVLETRKIAVLSTTLNIFTLVFLMFLLISHITSRSLSAPLNMIAVKIRKTTLGRKNEKIEWNSDDEIGGLVKEYNEMLEKLEESEKELAIKEKESAWREMAQQVAHEIKNPLTPMKLSLQHLQRTMGDGENMDRIKRTLTTLLTQIETLNDIATSFSSFARMPLPSSDTFDIVTSCQETCNLYANDEKVDLVTQIDLEECLVVGDKKLMGRILTNLVLNGIQAVEEDTRPQIYIGLKKVGNQEVLLYVQDNGIGISADLKDKVFVPKFSTKSTGSGIGLAVAKNGVEHAGGKIWFETEENKGTCFYIQLPILK